MSYITIYFGEKPVYLCDTLHTEIEEVRHHPDAVFIDELSSAAINSLLHEIGKNQFHAGIILHENLEKLKKEFFRHFKLVLAAGGLIRNRAGDILLIFRKGRWDLPKGKLDGNETLKECAVREVMEETGLVHLKAGKEMEPTYHTYVEFGKHILKESHWFLMLATQDDTLKPQVEEEITEIKWVGRKDINNYLDKTYPALVALLKNI